METKPTESSVVNYPADCKSTQARKKHKEKVLNDNPDTLYADFIFMHGKPIKNNLIFHTTRLSAWKAAICQHYKHVFKEGIGRGGRFTVCTDKNLDTDNAILTITYYTKGAILLQGNEESLNSFEEVFPLLKAEVDNHRDSDTAEDQLPTEPPQHAAAPPPPPSDNEPPQHAAAPLPSPSHSLSATDRQLRESLALLELDFVEFREFTQARFSDTTTSSIQQLREEVEQLRTENRLTVLELQETMKQLQVENQNLHSQVAQLEKEAILKERNLMKQMEDLRTELQENTRARASVSQNNATNTHTDHHTSPDTKTTNKHDTETTHTDTQTPLTQNTQPPPPNQSPPTKTNKQRPHVALLMDSNQKFMDPQKLFPGYHVTAKRCSTTGHALQLLNKESLGSPQCIIIHTGTNDLHYLRSDTAVAVCRVAERASGEFPEARIVVSTLLPRRDTPPHIIHGINTDISRGCAALPNVHLAHHPAISLHHLYDGLHLHKERVRIFARTLKDVALGRNPTTPTYPPPVGDYRPEPSHIPRYPPFPPRAHNTWTPPPPQPHTPYSPLGRKPYTHPHLRAASPRSKKPVHPTPPKNKKTTTLDRACPPQHRPQSYAAAVAQPPPTPTAPAKTEMGEIKEMLHTLCSRLLHGSI